MILTYLDKGSQRVEESYIAGKVAVSSKTDKDLITDVSKFSLSFGFYPQLTPREVCTISIFMYLKGLIPDHSQVIDRMVNSRPKCSVYCTKYINLLKSIEATIANQYKLGEKSSNRKTDIKTFREAQSLCKKYYHILSGTEIRVDYEVVKRVDYKSEKIEKLRNQANNLIIETFAEFRILTTTEIREASESKPEVTPPRSKDLVKKTPDEIKLVNREEGLMKIMQRMRDTEGSVVTKSSIIEATLWDYMNHIKAQGMSADYKSDQRQRLVSEVWSAKDRSSLSRIRGIPPSILLEEFNLQTAFKDRSRKTKEIKVSLGADQVRRAEKELDLLMMRQKTMLIKNSRDREKESHDERFALSIINRSALFDYIKLSNSLEFNFKVNLKFNNNIKKLKELYCEILNLTEAKPSKVVRIDNITGVIIDTNLKSKISLLMQMIGEPIGTCDLVKLLTIKLLLHPQGLCPYNKNLIKFCPSLKKSNLRRDFKNKERSINRIVHRRIKPRGKTRVVSKPDNNDNINRIKKQKQVHHLKSELLS
jgi:hypothetical protein